MSEDHLIELLRTLPPAPESWVAAAQDLATDTLGSLAMAADGSDNESAEEEWDEPTGWSEAEWPSGDDDGALTDWDGGEA
jgi:hypothetical protein